jgi:hypothetical protein
MLEEYVRWSFAALVVSQIAIILVSSLFGVRSVITDRMTLGDLARMVGFLLAMATLTSVATVGIAVLVTD